ncbi:SUKH-4 family immunity protein [Actinoplanes sp. Pm04-4]|uniref:SUKH-4 family immunity protein n=1 Tax=Paractinoplanes pyxinae TaxID=2997416 RepID=A0ABT4BI28_9ACTN|nr:SUKH-4 family immunity protein [Actinoplanes pyxinae]MCY1145495.1 SUKH-4 family immunity protein [Actinoplanes pyxinae]
MDAFLDSQRLGALEAGMTAEGKPVGELHDAVLSAIQAPIDSLIDPGVQVRPGVAVDRWDVPDRDRAILKAFGLPRGPLLAPAPQDAEEPLLTPNIAGEPEGLLANADDRLYLLGVYGSDFDAALTIRPGVVAGSGRVLGIRGRPLTVADIHPQLQPYHPDLYHPAVCYFNASLTAFVEIAWRWFTAVTIIRAHPEPSPNDGVEQAERYHAELDRCRSTFLAGMTKIDPTLTDNEPNSMWVETFLDD